MFNPLELKKRFVQSQIEKSFSDELEKAKYQVGQPHPNNPNILWTEWAPGKFDWKSKNGKYWKNKGGSTQSSNVKPVTAKEFSKNKNAVVEMLKNCDSKTDSNGDKRYHCEFYALGKDRGSSWLKKSDIEAYLRNYNDAKVTPIESDNASKEQKFKQNFKDASDDVLQKVVDGKIQATDSEKKWAQDILDERKKSDVKSAAGVKVEGNHGGSSDNHSVKLSGSEYKVRDDNGKDVTFASYIPKSLSNSDPRDKVAQKAGFKDYKEMKAHQDYVTAKSLLKKPSTKDSLKKQLEADVAKYEKEHADVIKRVAEKKDNDGKKKSSDEKITLKITTNGSGVVKLSDSVNAKWEEVKDEDFGGRIIGIKIDGQFGGKAFPYSFDSAKRKKYGLLTLEEAKARAEKYLNDKKSELMGADKKSSNDA